MSKEVEKSDIYSLLFSCEPVYRRQLTPPMSKEDEKSGIYSLLFSFEPVCVKTFIEVLGSCHIQLDHKEVARLERITQEDGMIEREQFIEFAKRSPAVKEFTMRGSKSRVSNLDKAELAFKVFFICIGR